MLNIEVFRGHWILFAMIAGTILMVLTVLTYIAIWRGRGLEKEADVPITDLKSFLIWFQKTFPWILILTIAGTGLLAFVYPLLKSVDPPNW